MNASVQAAARAHAEGDTVGALAILKHLWARGRHVALGDAIVALAATLPDAGEPPPPTDLKRLEKYIRKLPTPTAARKQLEAVQEDIGLDPRLTDLCIGLLKPRLHAKSRMFQHLLRDILELQRDPRLFDKLKTLPALEEFREGGEGGTIFLKGAEEHNRRMAGLYELRHHRGWRNAEMEREDVATLRRLGQGRGKLDPRTGQQRLEMWKAILAKPTDDGPKLVYADLLSQDQDPRGTFIVLQVAANAGTLDEAGQATMAGLFEQHRDEWFGRIEPALSLKLEHVRGGFLHHARIKNSTTRVLGRVGGARDWSLVREATLVKPDHITVLLDPAFKSLREVSGIGSIEQAAALSVLHPRLRMLSFATRTSQDPGTDHPSGLSRLRTLCLTHAQRAHLGWFARPLGGVVKVVKMEWPAGSMRGITGWVEANRGYAGRLELVVKPTGSSRLEVQTRKSKSGTYDLAVQLRGNADAQRAFLDVLPSGTVRVLKSTNAGVRNEAAERFPSARVGPIG